MLERLEALCNLYGVSGHEGPVRKYIKDAIAPHSTDIKVDAMGNLYAHKPGKGRRIMICAHMDEVGMLVRGILDNGLIAYTQSGIDSRVAVSKRVVVGKDCIPGVIGSKAIHLQTNDEFKRALKHDELYVDIGAKDKADAEKLVKLGDPICFDTRFARFGDGLVRSKALDDRVGCAMMIELLKNDYDCDLYAVFTVQEEIGLRGANAAVYNVAPELALVLEGTTANDMPTVEHGFVTKLGEGPAISFMDRGTIVRTAMFEALKATATTHGIQYQLRRGTTGGTDGGVIHKALSGCISGGISVPCRYIHSANSVASIGDIDGALKLADAFLRDKKFEEVLTNVQ
ncbi:MAG: M42 family peptidase [Clostridia bacterium]